MPGGVSSWPSGHKPIPAGHRTEFQALPALSPPDFCSGHSSSPGPAGRVLSVTEAWLAACARNGAGRLASFTRICLWVLRTARVVSCHPCSRCPQVAQLWKRARGNVTLKTDFASSASNARSLSAKSAHALVSGARVAYRRDQRTPVNRLDVLCFWKSEK